MIKNALLTSIGFLLTVLLACGSETSFPNKSEIIGLASPINLEFDTTRVLTEDFFINPSLIDSVSIISNLIAELSSDKSQILLIGNPDENMGVLHVWINGSSFDIPFKKSKKQEVSFSFDAGKINYNSVQLKGEMNSWNPNSTNLSKNGNVWETKMLISEGLYQYLYVIDGRETLDSSNEVKVSNGMGGFNNLLRVGNQNLSELPRISTQSYSTASITLETDLTDNLIVLWENHELEVVQTEEGASFSIPRDAKKMERSYIRAWGLNDSGISNDILIPLHKGKVLSSTEKLTRKDAQAWNMYFVLIDRFYDGNPANTRKVDDPLIHPKANYYGGDLAGITQKIENGYFQDLGITSLWLSPITQNPETAYGLWDKGGVTTKFSGYHGYWPISSSKIDDRFGTEEEFKNLLKVAHENGISVILDYVANHVHEDHPVYQRNKDWATNLYLPDGSLNTERWDDYRLTTWFDVFMPTLDFSRPEVIETMTDSALFWVKNYELDGFRHDATKHIQLEFWRSLTRKVKDEITIPTGRKVFQIGETYGSRELVASYINSGMLDSQFDFNMYDASLNAFGQNLSFKGLQAQLQESFNYFGQHNLMGYISGNHDKPRFITLTSGEVDWSEDAKLAGWTREIESPQAFAYDKLNLLHAFNQTIPGIPVTYMGDEYGDFGANDPDNRRWIRFEDEKLTPYELRNRNVFSKLAEIRNNNLALLFGDFVFHTVDDDILTYSRTYFNNKVMVIFNKSSENKSITIQERDSKSFSNAEAQFGNSFTHTPGEILITLPPNSVEILISNSK